MLQFKESLAAAIHAAIEGAAPGMAPEKMELVEMLEYPPDKAMGDLAFPCFKLSRALRKAPPAIAASLAESIGEVPYLKETKVAGGYLNFVIDDAYFTDKVLKKVLAEGEDYGRGHDGDGKTFVIDYSSPNVAKPFHIGHLGTTVIGHSLKKLHEFTGWKAIGINHLGDWGTQF
ncbi:MAG: arginine--tRNA ligase, partial [Clostridia bacterium]|nr:arginine--tRNA ligase [Clostridia bacterium]